MSSPRSRESASEACSGVQTDCGSRVATREVQTAPHGLLGYEPVLPRRAEDRAQGADVGRGGLCGERGRPRPYRRAGYRVDLHAAEVAGYVGPVGARVVVDGRLGPRRLLAGHEDAPEVRVERHALARGGGRAQLGAQRHDRGVGLVLGVHDPGERAARAVAPVAVGHRHAPPAVGKLPLAPDPAALPIRFSCHNCLRLRSFARSAGLAPRESAKIARGATALYLNSSGMSSSFV